MMLDKDKIKDNLTKEDIEILLKDLGSRPPMHGNQFVTVCHGGSKHKLYYFDESKSFHCFTECAANMDVYELVIKAKKQQGYEFSFPQAVQYVARITGKSYTADSSQEQISNKIDDWNWLHRFEKKQKVNSKLPTYDESVLDVFLPYPHETWLEEGISYESMNKFEVGYYMRQDCITLNHRDIDNNLVGIRGRMLAEEMVSNGKKYMPLQVEDQMYNHMTMMNLYGINVTKKAIKNLKKVMLYEGEKSVLKCEDYYGDFNFTCAVCNSSISNFHRDIILSLGVEEVFIAFDKFRQKKDHESDEKYEEKIIDYQERLIGLAKKFTSYCKVYILWDYDDLLDYKMSPCDKGKSVLEELMKNKIEITTNGVVV